MDLNGTSLEDADIAGIQAALFTGRVTARQLVDAYLDRIEAFDHAGPELNAVVTINQAAREQADELDDAYRQTGQPVGPLHGIPMVIKDCLETADMPTSFGSEIFADYRAEQDATVVATLRAAGAIILAKTTLPDWATSWFSYSSHTGVTKNPYDLGRDPGGSSSGTGAAIAAGYATVGLGTDCGGSVRLPASFCNLVGVRSTPGLISRTGCNPLVSAQDTIGPMARSVEDAARVFTVMAGFDRSDPLTYAYSVARAPSSYVDSLVPNALHGRRIGVLRSAFGADADPNAAPVNHVMASALDELRAGGATVVDVTIDDLSGWIGRTSLYTIKSKHDIDTWLSSKPNPPAHTVAEIIDSGRYHKKLDLLEALAAGPDDPLNDVGYYTAYTAREAFMKTVVNLMEANNLDTLVYPTCQVAPPTHEDTDSGLWNTLNFPTNTVIGSQTWMPSMTVPAGLTASGLPIGMEILARPYDEPTMFAVGYGFEQVIGHRTHPQSAPRST
ncbi:amidase [Arthrobacter agilis]|uniref:amidase n=1 Tax=Arthrobacter agilis TaxID=37921 RepID=UPI0027875D54|nr:amidase [Arthrobacter agilis]MDQ0734701.1 amidase [Arthrobacter agilis]